MIKKCDKRKVYGAYVYEMFDKEIMIFEQLVGGLMFFDRRSFDTVEEAEKFIENIGCRQ